MSPFSDIGQPETRAAIHFATASEAINGLGGADKIDGGAGNDKLFGGAGDDKLSGGAGADYLVGDGGNDRFIFGDISESSPVAPDIIADLSSSDRVDLKAIDANTNASGNQRFSWAGQTDDVIPSSISWHKNLASGSTVARAT